MKKLYLFFLLVLLAASVSLTPVHGIYLTVTQKNPPSGATVATAMPEISALIYNSTATPVNPKQLQLMLDGTEAPMQIYQVDSNIYQIRFKPSVLLANGTHTVKINYVGALEAEWSFTVANTIDRSRDYSQDIQDLKARQTEQGTKLTNLSGNVTDLTQKFETFKQEVYRQFGMVMGNLTAMKPLIAWWTSNQEKVNKFFNPPEQEQQRLLGISNETWIIVIAIAFIALLAFTLIRRRRPRIPSKTIIEEAPKKTVKLKTIPAKEGEPTE